jgi:hypothetical protein
MSRYDAYKILRAVSIPARYAKAAVDAAFHAVEQGYPRDVIRRDLALAAGETAEGAAAFIRYCRAREA